MLGLTAVPTSEQQLQQKLLASVLKRPYVQTAINDAKDAVQSEQITNLQGSGELPSGLPRVVNGVWPLFHTIADAVRETGGQAPVTIAGQRYYLPRFTPEVLKGLTDKLSIPIDPVHPTVTEVLDSETLLVGDSFSPAIKTHVTGDINSDVIYKNMTKVNDYIPDAMTGLYTCEVEKSEWLDGGVVSQRVHIEGQRITISKYADAAQLVPVSVESYDTNGAIYMASYKGVDALMILEEPGTGVADEKEAVMRRNLRCLTNAAGEAYIKSLLEASGSTAAEATAKFNEFKTAVQNTKTTELTVTQNKWKNYPYAQFDFVRPYTESPFPVEDGKPAETQRGLLMSDQSAHVLVFNHASGKMHWLTSRNVIDDVHFTANVQAVVKSLLAGSSHLIDFNGAAKFEPVLSDKIFGEATKYAFELQPLPSDYREIAQAELERVTKTNDLLKLDQSQLVVYKKIFDYLRA